MKLLLRLRERVCEQGLNLTEWGCIYVQHILSSNVQCVRFLESFGLRRTSIIVYGKAYSTSAEALREYVGNSYNARSIGENYDFLAPFDDEIVAAVRRGLRDLFDRGFNKILLIDEGGIAARALHMEGHPASVQIAATELTSRGSNAYGLIQERIPIVDVARSHVKKNIEAQVIAESMLDNLDRLLTGKGMSMKYGVAFGLIGAGAIGSTLATILNSSNIPVKKFDLCDSKSGGVALENVLQDCDVILSSTGSGIDWTEMLLSMTRSHFFVNCGSSDVEFNLWKLRTCLLGGSVRSATFSYAAQPWSGDAHLGIGKLNQLFLRGGFPVNFDGSADPIPPERIQLTRAILMAGAVQATRTAEPGVHPLEIEIQDFLLREFDSFSKA